MSVEAAHGTAHEAEAGAAVEHIEVDVPPHLERQPQLVDDEMRITGADAVADADALAVPVLDDEERLVGLFGLQEFELWAWVCASAHERFPDALGYVVGDAGVAVAVGGDDDVPEAAVRDEPAEEAVVVHVVAVGGVAVLDLHGDDVAVIEVADLLEHGLEVALDEMEVVRLGAAQTQAPHSEEPGGEAAEFPFGADVRAGAENHPEPQLVRQREEAPHIQVAAEVEGALPALVEVPGHVGRHRVEATGLELDQTVAPAVARNAEVVHLTGEDAEGNAVQKKLPFLDFRSHTSCSFVCVVFRGRIRRSASMVWRCMGRSLRTATASARYPPTMMSSFFARVMPV